MQATYSMPSQQSERTDLAVSDAFHRLKRTVLLFSAVLVVIALSEPAATGTLHMTLVDLELPLALARWLLWGAAAYYFAGFLLEARVCVRLNSNVFTRSSARNYEAAVGTIATDLQSHAAVFGEEIPKILQNYGAQTERLASAASQLATGPHTQIATFKSSDREGSYTFYRTATQEQIQQREDAIAYRALASTVKAVLDAQSNIERALELHLPMLERLADEARDVARVAQKAHRDLTSLNDLIFAERRWSFWAWEIGGASLAFAAATLALPYPASVVANSLQLYGSLLQL